MTHYPDRRPTQGRAGEGRSGVNGAPLRAGRARAAGLRAAEAVPGRDSRVLPRRLPLRPPRRLARLRYDYSIRSCICISLLLVPPLPLLGFQSFLFELKFKFRYPELESCLVLSLILQAVIVGGNFRDVQQDPRLERLSVIFIFKLITLSVS